MDNLTTKNFFDYFKNLKTIPEILSNEIQKMKKGGSIHIKKSNRGKFTDYCGGKVTQKCINKGKNSPDSKIRKRAVFAENARKFKH